MQREAESKQRKQEEEDTKARLQQQQQTKRLEQRQRDKEQQEQVQQQRDREREQHQREKQRQDDLAAFQRQKDAEAESLAARERLLSSLAEKCASCTRNRALSQALCLWQQLTVAKLQRNKRLELQLVFGTWCRQLTKVRLRREKLDSQLMAIDFNSPPSRVTKRPQRHSGARQRLVAKKRAATVHQNEHFVSVFGGQKTSLAAAKRCIMREFGCESLLLAPEVAVGSSLLRIQSAHLQQQLTDCPSPLGSSAPLLSGDIWSQDLFFHLGLITTCRRFQRESVPASCTWDHDHCILPNIFRTLLCSDRDDSPEHNSGTGETTVGLFESVVPCILGEGAGAGAGAHSRRHFRHVHMRVEDYPCGSTHTLGNHPIVPHQPLSAALVVVPDIMACLCPPDDTDLSNGVGRQDAPNIKLQSLLRRLKGEASDSSQSKRMRTQHCPPPSVASCPDAEDQLGAVEACLSGVLAACVPLLLRDTPVTVLLTRELIDFDVSLASSPHRSSTLSGSSLPASFQEITESSPRTEQLLLSIFTELLKKRAGREVTIKKSFSVHANFLNSDLYNTRNELFASATASCSPGYSGLSSIVSTCGECLFACLDGLAAASFPLQLIERVDPATWAEEAMLEALWSSSNHLEGREVSVKAVLGALVHSVNESLQEVCLDRVAHTRQEVGHHESSLFPFHLNSFVSTSSTIGGVPGVKGLLYNNLSDRKTPCCGGISSRLPLEWAHGERLEATSRALQTLQLPSPTEGSRYTHLLMAQGWRLSVDLRHKLDEVLRSLLGDMQVIDGESLVLSADQAILPSRTRLLDPWRVLTLHCIALKRLLGRAIQDQCATSREQVLAEDVYLLVVPAAQSPTRMLTDRLDSSGQFLSSSVFPLLREESEASEWESRCKRRHPLHAGIDFDMCNEHAGVGTGGGTARVVALLLNQDHQDSCLPVSIKKKSRLHGPGSASLHDTDEGTERDWAEERGAVAPKQKVCVEVRQLSEDCRQETGEVLDLESRLTRALLEGSDVCFGGLRECGSPLGLCRTGSASREERRALLLTEKQNMARSRSTSWADESWVSDLSAYDVMSPALEERQGLGGGKEKRKAAVNSTAEVVSASSAWDMISQLREERLDSESWLEGLDQ